MLVGIVSLVGIAVTVFLVDLSTNVLHANDLCQAPRPAPPAETALMPPRLSFDEIGTVTRVRKDNLHVMVHAVTSKTIDEVTVLIQDAVTAAGYRPAGMDNEGFEAEVFFSTESYGRRAGARARHCLQGSVEHRPGPPRPECRPLGHDRPDHEPVTPRAH